jgi:hypothetical protein
VPVQPTRTLFVDDQMVVSLVPPFLDPPLPPAARFVLACVPVLGVRARRLPGAPPAPLPSTPALLPLASSGFGKRRESEINQNRTKGIKTFFFDKDGRFATVLYCCYLLALSCIISSTFFLAFPSNVISESFSVGSYVLRCSVVMGANGGDRADGRGAGARALSRAELPKRGAALMVAVARPNKGRGAGGRIARTELSFTYPPATHALCHPPLYLFFTKKKVCGFA